MKRLVFVFLLSTASAQASDLSETWKDISSLRITSFVKAVLCGAAVYYTAAHATKHGGKALTETRNFEVINGFEQTALTAGLLFATFHFLTNHFWPYTKHALAIK